VILVAGILWPILSRIGLGRLPCDIVFERGGAMFYFPVVICIIISIVFSALFWAAQPVRCSENRRGRRIH
jgi:Protein of unknown function (DUF2905)